MRDDVTHKIIKSFSNIAGQRPLHQNKRAPKNKEQMKVNRTKGKRTTAISEIKKEKTRDKQNYTQEQTTRINKKPKRQKSQQDGQNKTVKPLKKNINEITVQGKGIIQIPKRNKKALKDQ